MLTPGETYRARFLVGADGASGQVRRLCAAGSWFSQGFALEVQTATPREEVDLTFDFASVRNGYAWIFPKGDHLNVGVYSLSSAAGLTRSRLLSYVQEQAGHRYGGSCYRAISGDRCRRELRPNMFSRIYVIGFSWWETPAASSIPSPAKESTARCSADRRRRRRSWRSCGERVLLRRHLPAISRGYRQTLRFSSRAAAAFYANPARGFRAMRLPFVRRSLVRTYTHGLNVKSLAMRIALAHC